MQENLLENIHLVIKEKQFLKEIIRSFHYHIILFTCILVNEITFWVIFAEKIYK